MTNVHHRLKSIQTDLLDDIKKENDELRSRVNELQSSIESGEREILTVSIKNAWIFFEIIGKKVRCYCLRSTVSKRESMGWKTVSEKGWHKKQRRRRNCVCVSG